MVKTGVKASEKHTNMLLPIMFGRNTSQQNRFLALVSNEKLLLDNLEVSMNSAEVGTIQALESLDSLDSKLNQVQVAYQQFYTTMGVEEVWKKFLDGATSAINTLNSLPKAFDKVPTGAIAMVANVIGLIKSFLQVGATEIAKVVTDIVHKVGNEGAAAAAQEGQRVAETATNSASSGLAKAWALPQLKTSATAVAVSIGQAFTTAALMIDKTSSSGRTLSGVLSSVGGGAQLIGGIFQGWAGIPNILMGIMNIINGIDLGFENSAEKLERLTEEAQKLNDEAKVAKAEYNSLQRTADKLDELKAKRYESAEAEQAYEDAVKSLSDKFPNLITGIDNLGVVTINATGLENELAKIRKESADMTLKAIEADRQKAEQDLKNNKQEQNNRIAQIQNDNDRNKLSSFDWTMPKEYVNNDQLKIDLADLGAIFSGPYDLSSYNGMLNFLQDIAGEDVVPTIDLDTQKKIITDHWKLKDRIPDDFYNKYKDLIDSFIDFYDSLESGISKAGDISKRIAGLNNVPQEELNKEVNDIVNSIEIEGLSNLFSTFMEWAESFNKGTVTISDLTKVVEGQERNQISFALNNLSEEEQKFLNEFGSNRDIIIEYIYQQAESWKNNSKINRDFNEFFNSEEGKSAFEEAYDSFKAITSQLNTGKLNEMWDNLAKYTVKDFEEILGSDNPLLKIIEEYYQKYIPNYISKLNNEIIPLTSQDNNFDDTTLGYLRSYIYSSKNIMTKDLYNWISNAFTLAQNYVDQGFTTAGNNILTGIIDVLNALETPSLDPTIRGQIIETLRNGELGTIEGIDALIQTLGEMDIEPPDGLLPGLTAIQKELNYNIPLGIQAWTDQLGAQTKSFTEAVGNLSKGVDIDEATAIMNAINTTEGGQVRLTDFAIKSGKFYVQDADLRRRYIESIIKEQDKAGAELQTKIDSVLNNSSLEHISNNIENSAIDNLYSIDFNKELFVTLDNLGFVIKDEANKFFKINEEAIQESRKIYGGETLTETVRNILTSDKEAAQEIQNELRAQVQAGLALESKDYESFIKSFFTDDEDHTDEINKALDLFKEAFETGNWDKVYAKYPQYAKQISETFATVTETTLDQIVNNIGNDGTLVAVDSKADADLLGKFSKFLTPIFDKETREITAVAVEITEDNLDEFIEAVRAQKDLTGAEKANLTEKATKAIYDKSDDALVNTMLGNLTEMSNNVYEQFRAKTEKSLGSAKSWENLFKDNGNGTYTFIGTFEELLNLINKITTNLTDNTKKQFNKLKLDTIAKEYDKGVGDTISKDTADFLNEIKENSVQFNEATGEYVIQSAVEASSAISKLYDEYESTGQMTAETAEKLSNDYQKAVQETQKVRSEILNKISTWDQTEDLVIDVQEIASKNPEAINNLKTKLEDAGYSFTDEAGVLVFEALEKAIDLPALINIFSDALDASDSEKMKAENKALETQFKGTKEAVFSNALNNIKKLSKDQVDELWGFLNIDDSEFDNYFKDVGGAFEGDKEKLLEAMRNTYNSAKEIPEWFIEMLNKMTQEVESEKNSELDTAFKSIKKGTYLTPASRELLQGVEGITLSKDESFIKSVDDLELAYKSFIEKHKANASLTEETLKQWQAAYREAASSADKARETLISQLTNYDKIENIEIDPANLDNETKKFLANSGFELNAISGMIVPKVGEAINIPLILETLMKNFDYDDKEIAEKVAAESNKEYENSPESLFAGILKNLENVSKFEGEYFQRVLGLSDSEFEKYFKDMGDHYEVSDKIIEVIEDFYTEAGDTIPADLQVILDSTWKDIRDTSYNKLLEGKGAELTYEQANQLLGTEGIEIAYNNEKQKFYIKDVTDKAAAIESYVGKLYEVGEVTENISKQAADDLIKATEEGTANFEKVIQAIENYDFSKGNDLQINVTNFSDEAKEFLKTQGFVLKELENGIPIAVLENTQERWAELPSIVRETAVASGYNSREVENKAANMGKKVAENTEEGLIAGVLSNFEKVDQASAYSIKGIFDEINDENFDEYFKDKGNGYFEGTEKLVELIKEKFGDELPRDLQEYIQNIYESYQNDLQTAFGKLKQGKGAKLTEDDLSYLQDIEGITIDYDENGVAFISSVQNATLAYESLMNAFKDSAYMNQQIADDITNEHMASLEAARKEQESIIDQINNWNKENGNLRISATDLSEEVIKQLENNGFEWSQDGMNELILSAEESRTNVVQGLLKVFGFDIKTAAQKTEDALKAEYEDSPEALFEDVLNNLENVGIQQAELLKNLLGEEVFNQYFKYVEDHYEGTSEITNEIEKFFNDVLHRLIPERLRKVLDNTRQEVDKEGRSNLNSAFSGLKSGEGTYISDKDAELLKNVKGVEIGRNANGSAYIKSITNMAEAMSNFMAAFQDSIFMTEELSGNVTKAYIDAEQEQRKIQKDFISQLNNWGGAEDLIIDTNDFDEKLIQELGEMGFAISDLMHTATLKAGQNIDMPALIKILTEKFNFDTKSAVSEVATSMRNEFNNSNEALFTSIASNISNISIESALEFKELLKMDDDKFNEYFEQVGDHFEGTESILQLLKDYYEELGEEIGEEMPKGLKEALDKSIENLRNTHQSELSTAFNDLIKGEKTFINTRSQELLKNIKGLNIVVDKVEGTYIDGLSDTITAIADFASQYQNDQYMTDDLRSQIANAFIEAMNKQEKVQDAFIDQIVNNFDGSQPLYLDISDFTKDQRDALSRAGFNILEDLNVAVMLASKDLSDTVEKITKEWGTDSKTRAKKTAAALQAEYNNSDEASLASIISNLKNISYEQAELLKLMFPDISGYLKEMGDHFEGTEEILRIISDFYNKIPEHLELLLKSAWEEVDKSHEEALKSAYNALLSGKETNITSEQMWNLRGVKGANFHYNNERNAWVLEPIEKEYQQEAIESFNNIHKDNKYWTEELQQQSAEDYKNLENWGTKRYESIAEAVENWNGFERLNIDVADANFTSDEMKELEEMGFTFVNEGNNAILNVTEENLSKAEEILRQSLKLAGINEEEIIKRGNAFGQKIFERSNESLFSALLDDLENISLDEAEIFRSRFDISDDEFNGYFKRIGQHYEGNLGLATYIEKYYGGKNQTPEELHEQILALRREQFEGVIDDLFKEEGEEINEASKAFLLTTPGVTLGKNKNGKDVLESVEDYQEAILYLYKTFENTDYVTIESLGILRDKYQEYILAWPKAGQELINNLLNTENFIEGNEIAIDSKMAEDETIKKLLNDAGLEFTEDMNTIVIKDVEKLIEALPKIMSSLNDYFKIDPKNAIKNIATANQNKYDASDEALFESVLKSIESIDEVTFRKLAETLEIDVSELETLVDKEGNIYKGDERLASFIKESYGGQTISIFVQDLLNNIFNDALNKVRSIADSIASGKVGDEVDKKAVSLLEKAGYDIAQKGSKYYIETIGDRFEALELFNKKLIDTEGANNEDFKDLQEKYLNAIDSFYSDLQKTIGQPVDEGNIALLKQFGYEFEKNAYGQQVVKAVGDTNLAAQFFYESLIYSGTASAEMISRAREQLENNFNSLVDDIGKGIGEEVSNSSILMLRKLGYNIEQFNGKYIITNIGDVEEAYTYAFTTMRDTLHGTAKQLAELRENIITTHNNNQIKGSDFINALTDLEMGMYTDISSEMERIGINPNTGNSFNESNPYEAIFSQLREELKKVGATIENGILMTTDKTDPLGLNKVFEIYQAQITEKAKEVGDNEIQNQSARFIEQLKDSAINLIKSYSDLIGKGIEGSLTNTEAFDLKKFAANHGIDLNFRETIDGLKLSQDQAIQLYQVMKQVDSLQAQITFQQLSDSLIENNSNFRNMTTLLAHIKDLENEIEDLPVNSKRREEYERELQVAKEIKETRSMTDPEYFDFMSGDLPDPMKGAETYWNSVNKAFTVMNQASESGYMSLTDFYNLANHMNDVAKQTGKTTEFMGVTLDGSLESASALIQKGYRAIENVDGEGAMVSLKAFGDNFEKGAAAMESGMQRGAKRMAKDQIEMLDAMIGLLEVVVAFEEFNELDIEGNGLDWYELFTPVGTDKEGNQIFEANEGTKKLAKQILDKAENDKDLKRALDEIIIDGTPLRKTMEDAANGNRLTKEKMEEYTKTIGILAKAAAEGDYSTENLTKLIQETFAGDEGTHEITVYGQTFAVKGDIVIKKENGKYTVNGKSFNTLDEAITAQELSDKYGIEKAYSNGKQVYGDIKVSQDTKIQVSKNIETSEEKITFNGQSYKTVDEALEAAIRSDYDKAVAKGYEGSIEDYIIENNLVAKFKLTSTQVSNIVGEPVSNLSDEMLKELGIDDKLVAAIEIGIEKALANFNLAQAIMDNLVPDFSSNEFGMAYTENPQVIALGEQLGKGIGPQITTAVVNALGLYFDTKEAKDQVGGAIGDGISTAAKSAEVTDKDYTIDEAHATLNSMVIDHVENPHFSSNILSDLLVAVGLKEKQSDLTLEKATAKVENLEINQLGTTSLKTGNLLGNVKEILGGKTSDFTIDNATAKVEELEINDIGSSKFSEKAISDNENTQLSDLIIDKASATITNLSLDNPDNTTFAADAKLNVDNAEVSITNLTLTDEEKTALSESVEAEIKAVVGEIDVSSIETAQQAVATAVTNASTSLSTLGTNISTAKTKVDNLAASLNTITENGPTRAKDFKTAINAIQEKGPTNTKNFKDAINAITATGPNQAKSFKEAVNSIAPYGPTYAKNFVNAVNSIKDKTFKVTGSVNVTVSISGALSARASVNTSIAKGNIALAAGKKQTLMGELGPELYVTNGHYYIAGQNGAEMVDLPDDAIVFNHLQTKKLLGSGKSGRGKPVTNEKNAVSYATGNAIGPAMSKAREVLELLKQLREMWKAMLNASSKQLGILSGKSDKKTDKKDDTPKTSNTNTPTKTDSGIKDSPTTTQDKISDNVDDIADDIHNAKPGHVVNTIQDLYNELREIESLTRKIEYQSNLQKLFENDRYNNGKQIGETIAKQYEMLGELLERQQATYTKEDKELQKDIANYEATPYGKFYDVVEDKVKLTDLDWLTALFEEDSTGAGINNATDYRTQVKTLLDYGIHQEDMIWYGGNKAVATYSDIDTMFDENGKQLDEAQMSQVWQTMVQNFVSRLDDYRDGFQDRLDSLNDRQNEIVDIVAQRNEILNQMIDLQMELENEVLDALEDQRQTAIDNSQKERDAFEESSRAYLDGLNKSLQREREMYQDQQNADELTKLQRQLEILRRSGGSASQIKSLMDQIQSKQQDMYFNQRQKEVDAIQDASDKQIQRMDEQIELMTETLEFEKEHGLLWEKVNEIMKQGTNAAVAFITENQAGWGSKSALAKSEDFKTLNEKFDTLNTLKETPGMLENATIKTGENLEAAVTKAVGVVADEEYGDGEPTDPVPEIANGTDLNNLSSNGSNVNSSNSIGDSSSSISKKNRDNDYIDFLTEYGLNRSTADKKILSKIKLPNSEKKYDYTGTIGSTNKQYTASFKDGKIVVVPANSFEKLTNDEIKEAQDKYLEYNKEKYVTDIANKYRNILQRGTKEEDIDYSAFKNKNEINAFKAIKSGTQGKYFGGNYESEESSGFGINYSSISKDYIRSNKTVDSSAAKILDRIPGVAVAPVDGKGKDYYIYYSKDFSSENLADKYKELIEYPKKSVELGTNRMTGSNEIRNFARDAYVILKQLGGFSQGGFVSDLKKTTIKNGDDTLTINTLKRGEAILTPEQASQFSSLVDYLPELAQMIKVSSMQQKLFEAGTNAFEKTMQDYSTILDNVFDNYFNTLEKIRSSNSDKSIEPSVNIEKFELTMNAKISDNYSAEQAGEAVFNKMVQMARKSGKTGSVSRR